jgi:predicted amidohydrolase
MMTMFSTTRLQWKPWSLLLVGLLLFSACAAGPGQFTVPSDGPFLVAAVQFNPKLNRREENVDRLLEAVAEAAGEGARLIVAPEMATTGYDYADREAVAPFVDTIPGKTTDRFVQAAQQYGVYIVAGLPEVDPDTGLYYNSAFLVGPEGYIGKYRKTHQWETEAQWAVWGDLGVPVFPSELGGIAVNICMDSLYFEPARLAALGGAHILVFPTNSGAQALAALQARAEQNGLYIVAANRTNTEKRFHMIGASAVWSPDGTNVAEAEFIPDEQADVDETTILYARIDPAKYDNAGKKRLAQRRPELYRELMLYVSPWDEEKTEEPKEITAALVQYDPTTADPESNVERIRRLIRKVNWGQNLDLVVLPELSTTGEVDNRSRAQGLSQTRDGDIVRRLMDLARGEQVHLVFGFIEREGDQLYNSAMLVGPDGEEIGTYRKTHLGESDKHWAAPGEDLPVFETRLGRMGMLIGEDVLFPEAAGVLMVDRADVIAIPSSWKGEYGKPLSESAVTERVYPEGALSVWDSTARTAQAYTLVANFVGGEGFRGRSALYGLDPVGGLDETITASGDTEEVLVVDFTTLAAGWWFNQEKAAASRRTHLYTPLISTGKSSESAEEEVDSNRRPGRRNR